MARRKPIRQDPAYQLYTSDFLVRNSDMSDEQCGQFIRLLCSQHQNGHLTEATMLSFCKSKKDELVFSRFKKDEKGLYYNVEMEKEVMRRAEVSKSKSENVNKRWSKEKDSVNTFSLGYDSDVGKA
jgi:hypothetical protein